MLGGDSQDTVADVCPTLETATFRGTDGGSAGFGRFIVSYCKCKQWEHPHRCMFYHLKPVSIQTHICTQNFQLCCGMNDDIHRFQQHIHLHLEEFNVSKLSPFSLNATIIVWDTCVLRTEKASQQLIQIIYGT